MKKFFILLILFLPAFYAGAKKPKPTYKRVGIEYGRVLISPSDPLSLSGNLKGAHYIWRTKGGFSYGFVYHQFDLKGTSIANSTKTTHLYKQETFSITGGIEMKGPPALSFITFNPQLFHSFHGKGSYKYKKNGVENRTSDLIEGGVALSGFEFPIYFDFQTLYFGGKYCLFNNSGPKHINYDSGGPDKIKINHAASFFIGWNFGGKKKVKGIFF